MWRLFMVHCHPASYQCPSHPLGCSKGMSMWGTSEGWKPSLWVGTDAKSWVSTWQRASCPWRETFHGWRCQWQCFAGLVVWGCKVRPIHLLHAWTMSWLSFTENSFQFTWLSWSWRSLPFLIKLSALILSPFISPPCFRKGESVSVSSEKKQMFYPLQEFTESSRLKSLEAKSGRRKTFFFFAFFTQLCRFPE